MGKKEAKARREVPVQERSRRRYETILDTAGMVFADRGFHAATMQGIADRAETSIGSLYRFFPDKRSLFAAMVARMAEREEQVFEALISSALSQSLGELISHTIDHYAAFQKNEPGWRAMWMNLHMYDELGEASQALQEKQLVRIEQLMSLFVPSLSTEAQQERRRVVAATIFDFLTGMLILHVRRDPAIQGALLEETKRILLLYIQALVEGAATPS